MSFIKIMVHSSWSTKNRELMITQDLKPIIINHILDNAKIKYIYIDTINCVSDHIHLLLSLGVDQTISKVLQLIKGESSFWVNNQKITKYKFEWQDDYFAISVSESVLEKVRTYIRNQEEHHRKKTFMEEYEEFIKKYNPHV
ncbi:MAG: transposase [bacterium]